MRPVAPHPFSMTWKHGLFVHWPVDPGQLRRAVPAPLALDTRDGRAWVSALPFVLADAGVRGQPSVTRMTVPELNLRTYVRLDGDPGLFFFSIDVGSRAVAELVRRLVRLPCFRASIHVDDAIAVDDAVGSGATVEFASTRDDPHGPPAHFAASYRPTGERYRPAPGTLEHWLVERRRFYAPLGGSVLYGEIAHDPWPLRPAEVTVHANTLFEAADVPTPTDEPRVAYCEELPMTGSILRRLGPSEAPSRPRRGVASPATTGY